ncbi:MAG TPA: hypothetical protein VG651_19095, partial [Stellaceae bacterium]|nr:hypothetical protein [Stellaceae bacterium]
TLARLRGGRRAAPPEKRGNMRFLVLRPGQPTVEGGKAGFAAAHDFGDDGEIERAPAAAAANRLLAGPLAAGTRQRQRGGLVPTAILEAAFLFTSRTPEKK